ncbi:hypothetical protein HDU96_010001 [Phlyctochytrium bullatum]|nr:hypothetical protein HDU96_010001 [Phlyctochytrium bullatum]
MAVSSSSLLKPRRPSTPGHSTSSLGLCLVALLLTSTLSASPCQAREAVANRHPNLRWARILDENAEIEWQQTAHEIFVRNGDDSNADLARRDAGFGSPVGPAPLGSSKIDEPSINRLADSSPEGIAQASSPSKPAAAQALGPAPKSKDAGNVTVSKSGSFKSVTAKEANAASRLASGVEKSGDAKVDAKMLKKDDPDDHTTEPGNAKGEWYNLVIGITVSLAASCMSSLGVSLQSLALRRKEGAQQQNNGSGSTASSAHSSPSRNTTGTGSNQHHFQRSQSRRRRLLSGSSSYFDDSAMSSSVTSNATSATSSSSLLPPSSSPMSSSSVNAFGPPERLKMHTQHHYHQYQTSPQRQPLFPFMHSHGNPSSPGTPNSAPAPPNMRRSSSSASYFTGGSPVPTPSSFFAPPTAGSGKVEDAQPSSPTASSATNTSGAASAAHHHHAPFSHRIALRDEDESHSLQHPLHDSDSASRASHSVHRHHHNHRHIVKPLNSGFAASNEMSAGHHSTEEDDATSAATSASMNPLHSATAGAPSCDCCDCVGCEAASTNDAIVHAPRPATTRPKPSPLRRVSTPASASAGKAEGPSSPLLPSLRAAFSVSQMHEGQQGAGVEGDTDGLDEAEQLQQQEQQAPPPYTATSHAATPSGIPSADAPRLHRRRVSQPNVGLSIDGMPLGTSVGIVLEDEDEDRRRSGSQSMSGGPVGSSRREARGDADDSGSDDDDDDEDEDYDEEEAGNGVFGWLTGWFPKVFGGAKADGDTKKGGKRTWFGSGDGENGNYAALPTSSAAPTPQYPFAHHPQSPSVAGSAGGFLSPNAPGPSPLTSPLQGSNVSADGIHPSGQLPRTVSNTSLYSGAGAASNVTSPLHSTFPTGSGFNLGYRSSGGTAGVGIGYRVRAFASWLGARARAAWRRTKVAMAGIGGEKARRRMSRAILGGPGGSAEGRGRSGSRRRKEDGGRRRARRRLLGRWRKIWRNTSRKWGRWMSKAWDRWLWYIGFILYIIPQLFGSVVSLIFISPMLLAPLGSAGLIFNVLFSALLLGTRVTIWEVGGTILIVLGGVMVSVFGGSSDEGPGSVKEWMEVFGRPLGVVWFSGITLGVTLLLVAAGFLGTITKKKEGVRGPERSGGPHAGAEQPAGAGRVSSDEADREILSGGQFYPSSPQQLSSFDSYPSSPVSANEHKLPTTSGEQHPYPHPGWTAGGDSVHPHPHHAQHHPHYLEDDAASVASTSSPLVHSASQRQPLLHGQHHPHHPTGLTRRQSGWSPAASSVSSPYAAVPAGGPTAGGNISAGEEEKAIGTARAVAGAGQNASHGREEGGQAVATGQDNTLIGMMFAMAGGGSASGTLLLGKSGIEIAVLSFSAGAPNASPEEKAFSIALVVLLVLTVIIQLYALNKSIALTSPLLAVPTFYTLFTVLSLLNSLIGLGELWQRTLSGIMCLCVGVGTIIGGVWCLRMGAQ